MHTHNAIELASDGKVAKKCKGKQIALNQKEMNGLRQEIYCFCARFYMRNMIKNCEFMNWRSNAAQNQYNKVAAAAAADERFDDC